MQKGTNVTEQTGGPHSKSLAPAAPRGQVTPQVRSAHIFLHGESRIRRPPQHDRREEMIVFLFLILHSLCFPVLYTRGIPQHFPHFCDFFSSRIVRLEECFLLPGSWLLRLTLWCRFSQISVGPRRSHLFPELHLPLLGPAEVCCSLEGGEAAAVLTERRAHPRFASVRDLPHSRPLPGLLERPRTRLLTSDSISVFCSGSAAAPCAPSRALIPPPAR